MAKRTHSTTVRLGEDHYDRWMELAELSYAEASAEDPEARRNQTAELEQAIDERYVRRFPKSPFARRLQAAEKIRKSAKKKS